MAVAPSADELSTRGHSFAKKTFHKPTYCHHCSDLLWGLIGQGYNCEVCNFIVHERCVSQVVTACSSIATSLIKNPVAHCWSEPAHHKRKFCTVCRKRLDETPSLHCMICEYYVHGECADFAAADCRENATYAPEVRLTEVRHRHHWREGNLPASSKCVACRRACWSAECFTGYRCEWCGLTCHGGCRCLVSLECTFGMLQPIYLPPHAVSVPRAPVPLEALIGVQPRPPLIQREQSCPELRPLSRCGLGGGVGGPGGVGGCRRSAPDVRRPRPPRLPRPPLFDRFALPAVLRRMLPRACAPHCQYSPPYSRARSISDDFNSDGSARGSGSGTGTGAGQAAGSGTGAGVSGTSGGGGTTPDQSPSPRQQDDVPPCASASASSSSSHHRGDHKGDHKNREKEDRDEEVIKVYDGNQSLRRYIFRTVSLPRTAGSEACVRAALAAFHLAGRRPACYRLTDALHADEPPLQDPHPLLRLTRRDNKRPAVFLRFRDKENMEGSVRVWAGRVALSASVEGAETCANIPVDGSTTVTDLVSEALVRFGLGPPSRPDDYRCSEMLLDRGGDVTERVLGPEERPWEIVKRLGRESIRQAELMRFCLQPSRDPHGPKLALFVGNLPPGLSERNYENMLMEFLGKENKFSSIGPIYYEYGSMVITYEDANRAVKALLALREARMEDKTLLVLLLPNIEPSMVPAGVKPLLVFVNVKSGGCQGLELISSFRKLLNPYQVFDLDNGGPLPGLYVFRHIKDYKILVCGGDGTIGWVLQCLDNVGQDSECSSPPCAIVPLGTGNDLARVLRWGPGYTGGEDPLSLLRDVIEAEEIRLDRWTVVFHPEDKPDQELPKQLPTVTTAGSQSEDNSQIFVMNNYFGIGIDADLCLDFHNAREENPNKFNSRLRNKGVYVKMGLRKMVGRCGKLCRDLQRELRLEVDGRHVELPPVEGIIILNILSWGSGANPWGPEKEDHFSKPNHWDGMLEVVGVTGVVHLGQIQSGLRSAMRIAQGGHIKIHLKSDIPVQVDGEPWVQSPGEVVVLKSALKATMLKKLKSKMKRRNTEPSMGGALSPHPDTEDF